MPTSKLIHSLPDAYWKDTDGNNFKLLSLHGEAVDTLRADAEAVLRAQDLQTAIGRTLDRYGAEIDQARGSANDALYRLLIQQKLARSRGTGTWESVTSGVRNVLNCGAEDFYVYDNSHPHKAVLRVRNEEVLGQCPLPTEEMKRVLNHLLPASVDFVTVVPFPGSSSAKIQFVPAHLLIRSCMNIWKLHPVKLNGLRQLDGTWVLNQEVRNHFLLAKMRVFSRIQYDPECTVNLVCGSHNAVLSTLNAKRMQIFSHQQFCRASKPIWNAYQSTQKIHVISDPHRSVLCSHGRFRVLSATVPEWYSHIRATTGSMPVETGSRSSQAFSIQQKMIRKSTNPIWTLNGIHNLDGVRRLNAGRVTEEVL